MDRGNVSVVERKIRYYNGSRLMERSVSVIQESFLSVFLNERAIARIACLGVHPEELAVGFLRSEGLLTSREDLRSIRAARGEVRIEAAETERKREKEPATLLSSGSRERGTAVPKPIPPASLPFSPADILRLMEEHLESTALHAQTRGTHGSSLADERGLFLSREDVGRHNTIDMIGGHLLLRKLDGAGKILFTTGRLSSEMVRKVWNLGIPLLASHAAATSQGIETARQGGITLMGCVRSGTMKIYTHHERISY